MKNSHRVPSDFIQDPESRINTKSPVLFPSVCPLAVSPHQGLASKDSRCTHRIGGTSCPHHQATGFASKSQQHSESNSDNPLQSACTGIEAYRCFQEDQGLWPPSGWVRVSLESSARLCSTRGSFFPRLRQFLSGCRLHSSPYQARWIDLRKSQRRGAND